MNQNDSIFPPVTEGSGAIYGIRENNDDDPAEKHDILKIVTEEVDIYSSSGTCGINKRKDFRGDGDNARQHFVMGGNPCENRTQVVPKRNTKKYTGCNSNDEVKGRVSNEENVFKRVCSIGPSEEGCYRQDGRTVLETECNATDCTKFCRYSQKHAKHPRGDKQRNLLCIPAKHSTCNKDRFKSPEVVMPDWYSQVETTDTGIIIFAWYRAMSVLYDSDKWNEMMDIVCNHKAPNTIQWQMIRTLYDVIYDTTMIKSTEKMFQFEYASEWTIQCVTSHPCSVIEYSKFLRLLCDNGDERSVAILLRSRHIHGTELACLTLGTFSNDATGIDHAMDVKETISVLNSLGLANSGKLIVHMDPHNSTSITLLIPQKELDEVQIGLMTQLDMQNVIPHSACAIALINDMFTGANTSVRCLSAFAILIGRCCTHSNLRLLQHSICKIRCTNGQLCHRILSTLKRVISTGTYFVDTIQSCANVLLNELKIDHETSCYNNSKITLFIDTLGTHAFTATVDVAHMSRWPSLVSNKYEFELPIGSEHAFMSCIVCAPVAMACICAILPNKRCKFIALDKTIRSRLDRIQLPTSVTNQRRTITHFKHYDIDRLLDMLNAPTSNCTHVQAAWKVVNNVGSSSNSNFVPFSLFR